MGRHAPRPAQNSTESEPSVDMERGFKLDEAVGEPLLLAANGTCAVPQTMWPGFNALKVTNIA